MSDPHSYERKLAAKLRAEAERRGYPHSDLLNDAAQAIEDLCRGPSRDEIIEECARAIEPANNPLLAAAVRVIRGLKHSSATHSEGEKT